MMMIIIIIMMMMIDEMNIELGLQGQTEWSTTGGKGGRLLVHPSAHSPYPTPPLAISESPGMGDQSVLQHD